MRGPKVGITKTEFLIQISLNGGEIPCNFRMIKNEFLAPKTQKNRENQSVINLISKYCERTEILRQTAIF